MRLDPKILVFMIAFGIVTPAKISWAQQSPASWKSWAGLPPDQFNPQTKTSLFENKLFLEQVHQVKTPEEWQDVLRLYDFNSPIELVDNYLVVLAEAKPVENPEIPYHSEQQRDLAIIFDWQQGKIISLCQSYHASSWQTPGPQSTSGLDNSFTEAVNITYYLPTQPPLTVVLRGSVGDCGGGNAETAVERWISSH